jgi:FixJ family two-component response regulator
MRRCAGRLILADMNFMPPTPAPRCVVIVDDDPAVCDALKFSMELEGYHVDTCASGEQLLLRDLPKQGVCLVIDQRLPGITGLSALAQLRRRGVDLPAILITTNPGTEVRMNATAAGAPIVEKPLIGDALLAAVREALEG